MRRSGAALAACLVAAALAPTAGRAAAHPTPVVRSLEPAKTAKLWRELVAHPRRFRSTAQSDCRPLRGVFYAQTDWLRLATRLAAQPSPCAQYFISVPPLAADKTKLRTGEAAKIRALGPSFHALAEIHYAGWSKWVTDNASTFFDAGVEARKRMEAAGFDVSKGDTWVVNEFPSSVRVGTGSDRANARELVRGLFTGDGTAQAKGAVFIVGVGQSVPDTTLYQTNLQNWMGDAAFWTDMSSYISDWSQEVYPDWRKVAVPGTAPQQRRDPLNDYLEQSGLIIDRLAAAIRDSAAVSNPADPGIEACTNTCGGEYPGAAFTSVWQSFRTWTQPVLTFTTAPQTIAAGAASGPMALALLNATGAAQVAQAQITITLSSSSPSGQFSLAPTGPWTPTLVLSIPAGASTVGPFYYLDTKAGSQTITAAAAGVTSGTQAETVLPGPPLALKVTTTARTVASGGTATLSATGTDQYGNAVPVSATWTVEPAGLGVLRPPTGASVDFTAGPKGGNGTVTATGSGLSASTTLAVGPGPVRVGSVRYGIGAGKTLLVTVSILDLRGRPVRDAFVSLLVRRRGYRFFSSHGTTAANGRKTFRLRHMPGCYRTTVLRVSANGYRWDRATPVNRFCK